MLESGQILAGRYALLRRLGEGRGTAVWQARDRVAGADRALKILTSDDPLERERFLAAARLQRGLAHPRLQACVELHEQSPVFAVFEVVAAADATQLRGRPWPALLPVLAGVAEGLAALHEAGLVHRDLKPANVLLDADGAPLLADFGLAARAGDAAAPRGGSPFTVSPAQLDGAPPEPADDVYGFGALAYELLSGYPPFYPDASPARVRHEPPASLAGRAGIPRALDELVLRCLAKAPADRPASLREVTAALGALAATPPETTPARAVSQAPTLRPPAAEEAAITSQWSRATATGPDATALRAQGFRRGLLTAGFLLLVAGAAFVFLLLPRWVEERSVTAPAPTVAAPPPPKPSAPAPDLERLAALRKQYEDLRPQVLQRLGSLESRGAGRWGGETFARGKQRLADSDAVAGRREYAVALERLREADADFVATGQRAAGVLRAALADGAKALEAGDGTAARGHFELALAVDPAHAGARRGLERAATAGEVSALLAEGRSLEERGEAAAAETAYRKALALDRDAAAARAGLARLAARAGNAAYAAALSQALEALARRDYAAARSGFEQAGRLRPGSAEVAEGLAQVERALGDRALTGHVEAARRAEREERWSDALGEYRKALTADRNLLAAQQGLERAEPRAQLDAELATYLERPERLFSSDVRAAARAALARARGITDPGPRLQRQLGGVEALLQSAETPQRVALASDNLTEVTVYRVGRLGAFDRKELELLPGRYTVVGVRAGYRDVRRELTLLPGREPPTVDVRCEEPI